jgi:hypothetical protein
MAVGKIDRAPILISIWDGILRLANAVTDFKSPQPDARRAKFHAALIDNEDSARMEGSTYAEVASAFARVLTGCA